MLELPRAGEAMCRRLVHIGTKCVSLGLVVVEVCACRQRILVKDVKIVPVRNACWVLT